MHYSRHSKMMFVNHQTIALCFTTFTLVVAVSEEGWNYDDMQTWCNVSETCCKGKRQSPIDLTDDTKLYTKVKPFIFTGYDKKPTVVELENDNVQVIGQFADITPKPTVSGIGLDTTYWLEYFRFAWGKDDTEGSEHSINGVHGPLELHYIHYNTKFSNTSAASDSGEKDALFIMSIIFKIGEENPILKKITDKLEGVTYAGDIADAEAFEPKDLLPSSESRFFKYYGSYTVPGCKEIVLRVIFEETPPVSSKQMEKFRTLYQTAKGVEPKVPITHCFRPIQQLNGRTIEHDQQE